MRSFHTSQSRDRCHVRSLLVGWMKNQWKGVWDDLNAEKRAAAAMPPAERVAPPRLRPHRVSQYYPVGVD